MLLGNSRIDPFGIGHSYSRFVSTTIPISEAGKALYSGSAAALRTCLEAFRKVMSAPHEALEATSKYLDETVVGTLIGNTNKESDEWKNSPLLNRGMASSLRIIGSGISAPFAGIAMVLYAIGNFDKFPEQCKNLHEKLSTPEGRYQFAEEASKTLLQTGSSMAGALLGFTIVASLPISWPVVGGGLALAGVAFIARGIFNAFAASDDKGEIDIKRFTGKMMKDVGEAVLAFGVGICWGAASAAIIAAVNSVDVTKAFGRREAMGSMAEGGELISQDDLSRFRESFSYQKIPEVWKPST